MLPRNITRITTSVLKNSPYTFNVVWSKSNFMLVEINQKPPQPGKTPDYDMEAQHPDSTTRDEKIAGLNSKGYF